MVELVILQVPSLAIMANDDAMMTRMTMNRQALVQMITRTPQQGPSKAMMISGAGIDDDGASVGDHC